MEAYLIYLLKASVCFTFFYLLFRVILVNDKNFGMVRVCFYAFIVFSLLLPLTQYSIVISHPVFEKQQPVIKKQQPIIVETVDAPQEAIAKVQVASISTKISKLNTINWQAIIQTIYITGVCLLLIRLLTSIILFSKQILGCKKHKYNGFTIIFTDQSKNTCSFFRWIFIPENKFNESELDTIITHEKIHVFQYHTIDLLLVELLTAVMWFNPVMWMMRKSLQQLHEYLADEGVLNTGVNRLRYQALLVNQVAEERLISLSSNFNHSLIKKRIIMMTSSNKKQKTKAKMLLVLPIAAAMFFTFAYLNGQNKPLEAVAENSSINIVTPNSIITEKADLITLNQPVKKNEETSSKPETYLNSALKDTSKKQTKKIFAVSPTKMNVLYIGVANPLSIVVSDVAPEKLMVQISNGTIRKANIDGGKEIADGQYVVFPKEIGNATITLSSEGVQLGIMEFRVKTVPDPTTMIAGKRGGEITKEWLLDQNTVSVEVLNFDFDLNFKVVEFTISAAIGGFVKESSSKSNEITEDQKNLIRSLNKDDRIYFQDIKAVGPDGIIRNINSIYFKIQ